MRRRVYSPLLRRDTVLERMKWKAVTWLGSGILIGLVGAVVFFRSVQSWVSFAWFFGWLLAASWIYIHVLGSRFDRAVERFGNEEVQRAGISDWRGTRPVLTFIAWGYAVALFGAMALEAASQPWLASRLFNNGFALWVALSNVIFAYRSFKSLEEVKRDDSPDRA